MVKQFDWKKFLHQIFEQEGGETKSLEGVVNGALTGLIKAKKGKGIAEYLDTTQIKDSLKRMQRNGYDIEKIKDRLYNGISGGKYLTNRGKEILLKERLKHSPTLLDKIIHPVYSIKQAINPSYNEKVIHAVTEIMQYAEAGGLKESMPEWLVNDAAKLQNLYFLGTATKIFGDYGLMSKHEARRLEYLADKKIRSEGENIIKKTREEIKKYGFKQPVSVAAAILIAASFFLLGFSASNISGFVIADRKINSAYPIGVGFILLIIAFCFSLLRKKKRQKKARKK